MKGLRVLIGSMLLSSFPLLAQVEWEPTVRLTNSYSWSYLPYNNARCIEASGHTIHAVWGESPSGSSANVFYKQSRDNGATWTEAVQISTAPTISNYPSMAVSEPYIHVFWKDLRDGNPEIYYRHSVDDGESWLSEVRLTEDVFDSDFPSSAASDSFVHVVWQDIRAGNLEVFYKRSSNNGETWGEDTRLSSTTGNSRFPCIEANGPELYVVWYDDTEGNYEIYFLHSRDNGETWEAEARLTEEQGSSEHPSIEIDGGNIHLAWMDDRNEHPANAEIYYMLSTDNGETWGQEKRLSDAIRNSYNPSISVADSNVFISWHDQRLNTEQIYFIESRDLGASWSADTNISSNAFTSYSPFSTVSDSFLHVIWHDPSEGNHEIMYKRGRIPAKEPEPGCVEIPADDAFSISTSRVINENSLVRYKLPYRQEITLSAHDATGRLLGILDSGIKTQGNHNVSLDITDYPSGVYFFVLTTKESSFTRKTILIK